MRTDVTVSAIAQRKNAFIKNAVVVLVSVALPLSVSVLPVSADERGIRVRPKVLG